MKQYKRFKLVELTEFTGRGAAIYSIALDGENDTLYDLFLTEYREAYPTEIAELEVRLETLRHWALEKASLRPMKGPVGPAMA